MRTGTRRFTIPVTSFSRKSGALGRNRSPTLADSSTRADPSVLADIMEETVENLVWITIGACRWGAAPCNRTPTLRSGRLTPTPPVAPTILWFTRQVRRVRRQAQLSSPTPIFIVGARRSLVRRSIGPITQARPARFHFLRYFPRTAHNWRSFRLVALPQAWFSSSGRRAQRKRWPRPGFLLLLPRLRSTDPVRPRA